MCWPVSPVHLHVTGTQQQIKYITFTGVLACITSIPALDKRTLTVILHYDKTFKVHSLTDYVYYPYIYIMGMLANIVTIPADNSHMLTCYTYIFMTALNSLCSDSIRSIASVRKKEKTPPHGCSTGLTSGALAAHRLSYF